MISVYELGMNTFEDFAVYFPPSILDYFIEDEAVRLYGIDSDLVAIGGIAARVVGPLAELKWVFVAEDYRGLGHGSEAFSQFISQLYDEGLTDMEVELAPKASPKLKEMLRGFRFTYEEMGQSTYSTTVGELTGNSYLGKPSTGCSSLEEMTAVRLNKLYERMKINGGDLVDLPINRKEFNSSVSAVVEENNEARGLLLVSEENTQYLRIPLMYSDSSNPMASLNMMRYSVAEAGRKYSADTKVEFDFISQEMTDFGEKILGGHGEHMLKGHLDLTYLENYKWDKLKPEIKIDF